MRLRMLDFLIIFIISTAIATCAKADVDTYKPIIISLSDRYGIDPVLVQAIVTVESNGNPKAVGKLGEIGLMQLRPEFHPGVSFNPKVNLSLGIRYLAYIKERCPNRRDFEWITCYNKGTSKRLKQPTKNRYYRKVMEAYGRLINEESKDAGNRYRPRNRTYIPYRTCLI